MADNEFNGYKEESERFTFEEKCSLTIPKQVRELAYHISIDIEILSVAKEPYMNYGSSPAHSFYGYVIIVLRDMSMLKIPIENSRQRLFTDIIHNAFNNWYNLYLSFLDSQFHKGNNAYLAAIGAALAIEPQPNTVGCASAPVFIETEIREIYVKTAYGTRFALEINWWQPNPVKYGECEYDGKSGQLDDPKKDSGLPDRTKPKVVDNPDNPYAGYPPPSSGEDLAAPSGNWNNLGDLDGLDGSNPDNEPEPNQSSCLVTAVVDFGDGNGATETFGAVVSTGDYFSVERWEDATSPTGFWSGITVVRDGVKVGSTDGVNVNPDKDSRTPWTAYELTITSVCTPI